MQSCRVWLFLLGLALLWKRPEAGEPLPPEAQFLTMTQFRSVNPDIQEDWTDYMQDLAGEYTTCDIVLEEKLGAWTLPGILTPVRKQPVGVLMGYVPEAGTSRQDKDEYARQIFGQWVQENPFRRQIEIADNFGCSIAPGCPPPRGDLGGLARGYTVIGCAFVPACPNEGCREPQEIRPTIIPPRAKAFTPAQYDLAETLFSTALRGWDRSHLLENLSGTETDCEMIGAAAWAFDKANYQARFRGFTVYGRFGYAPNLGRTEPALEQILNDIRDEELARTVGGVPNLKMGCSVMPDCYSARAGRPNQMYVVVSCLFSTDSPDWDY